MQNFAGNCDRTRLFSCKMTKLVFFFFFFTKPEIPLLRARFIETLLVIELLIKLKNTATNFSYTYTADAVFLTPINIRTHNQITILYTYYTRIWVDILY